MTIRLPFGLVLTDARTYNAVIDHVARLLTERCNLIVRQEQDNAVINVQQKAIIGLERTITGLKELVCILEEQNEMLTADSGQHLADEIGRALQEGQ